MMSMKFFSQKPKRSGLAIHAVQAALAPSRVLTSHLREWFSRRYHRQYRFSRLVFAFDLSLLAIATMLVVLDVSLFLFPFSQKQIGIDLVLRASPLISETRIPIEVVLRATDGVSHENVSIVWNLPPWVEIVSSEPPLSSGRVATIGTVTPTGESVSRIIAVIRAASETDVPFTFRIQEGAGFQGRSFTGSESRPIVKSALTAVPAMAIQAVEPNGTIPFLVKNNGTVSSPAVVLRLTASSGASRSSLGQGNEIRFGEIPPGEERVAYLTVVPDEGATRVEFQWELQDLSRQIHVGELSLDIASPVDVSVEPTLRSVPGRLTRISYDSSGAAGVWVFHPLQETNADTHARVYDISGGSGIVNVPMRQGARTSDTVWSVIPFAIRNGSTVFGKREVGVLSTPFHFQTAARYYAQTGDQIGVGPLPPIHGETTSFWIVWSIGPTDAELKDVSIDATLPPNVRATGKSASEVAGDFSVNGSDVSWSIPSLPQTGDAPKTFAFEIEITPSASDIGKSLKLIGKSYAKATEVRSGASLEAESPSESTDLEKDAMAKGMGIVQ
ncbi:MAG: hypothetical protein AAB386_04740 [Patescibacteria group bacterium]